MQYENRTPKSNREIANIGVVREVEDEGHLFGVGVANGDKMNVNWLNDERKKLPYAVGTKAGATGTVSKTNPLVETRTFSSDHSDDRNIIF